MIRLKKGSKIGIVAPAGKIKKGDLDNAIDLIKKHGFTPVIGKYVYQEFYNFAGTDQERLEDFQGLLDDKTVDVIWCARGGYGTIRIINKLDFSNFNHHPKLIIGYSDITILHSYLNTKGYKSIHAAMPNNINHKESVNKLFEFLTQEHVFNYTLKSNEFNKLGSSRGVLVGGNLAILYSLRGTPSDIDYENKVLFIEDIGEHLYAIDRMIQNLKYSGILKRLAGIIVGGFSNLKDTKETFGKSAYEIIKEAVEEYHYPVAFGFEAGHCTPNMPLVFGDEIELHVGKDAVNIKAYLD